MSKEKLSEALKLLDEASKDKKDEVESLIQEKYSHLRNALHGSDARITLESFRQKAADAAARARDVSEEKVKELATQVDRNVRANPWPYIGGVALAALVLGYLIGRKK